MALAATPGRRLLARERCDACGEEVELVHGVRCPLCLRYQRGVDLDSPAAHRAMWFDPCPEPPH